MLAILDYRAGNQTSVLRALSSLGIPAQVTDDPTLIDAADGVIFPGVGSAGQAMSTLSSLGLDSALRRSVEKGQPILGICLGCQILLERSEEHDVTTLGIVPGATRLFPAGLLQDDGTPAPIPHMGWNTVSLKKDDVLFKGIDDKAQFYFVHSYYVDPAPSLVLGTTHYGMDFCSFYGRPGLWACQFHPEKSGRYGLMILKNFHDYCREAANAL